LVDWWRGAGTAVDGLLRLAGPYFSPNQAALYLERTLFLGVGLFWARPRGRGWLAAAGGLLLVALLLTASRGALLLGLPAGALLWAWGWWRWQAQQQNARLTHRPRRLVILAALALAGLAVLLLVLLLGERLTNSATILHRLTIWQSSLALWRDFPWLGVGPGGFFWHYPAYLPLGALDEPNLYHPHNLWLEMATGWGVLGLLWLGLLLWWLTGRLRVALRAPAPLNGVVLALLAAFAAGLAHAQVDAFLVLPDLALWSWLALALLDRLVPDTLNPRVRTTVGGD
jgi:O-antigen ligase